MEGNIKTSERERFSSIDMMKAIAAFFIINIHVLFPGKIGSVMVTISRIAVPFFFMVSGFILWNIDLTSMSKNLKTNRIFATSDHWCKFSLFYMGNLYQRNWKWYGIGLLKQCFNTKRITKFSVSESISVCWTLIPIRT